MNKIVIIGCPGSGKTTLANKLGTLLHVPVHHLDKIFWTETDHIKQDIFVTKQEEIMKNNQWIIDGNFTKSIDTRLLQADTIIFFEFPKIILYWRLVKRYAKHFNTARPDMGGDKKDSMNTLG